MQSDFPDTTTYNLTSNSNVIFGEETHIKTIPTEEDSAIIIVIKKIVLAIIIFFTEIIPSWFCPSEDEEIQIQIEPFRTENNFSYTTSSAKSNLSFGTINSPQKEMGKVVFRR